MAAKEYDIGPCAVSFTPAGGTLQDLGNTSGGVKLTISTDVTEIEVDQESDPVDAIVTKSTKLITVPMAEFSLNNLLLAMPGSELITDGTTPTKKKLVVKSLAGKSLKNYAGKLVLHPTSRETSDVSMDFVFWNAAPNGNIEISWTKNDLKVITVEFKPFRSEDPATEDEVMVIGDTTAVAAED